MTQSSTSSTSVEHGDVTLPSILLALSIIGIAVLIRWIQSKRRNMSLPPGPKGLPIVGNLFDLPTVQPWKTYLQWSEKYGDLVFLNLPAQPTIILKSAKAAFELFEKRSHLYSDRHSPIMDQLIFWDFSFAHMRYGPVWRNHRRTFHQYFHLGVVSQYQPIQQAKVYEFLRRALESHYSGRDDVAQSVRLIYASIILKIVYNMDIQDVNDKYLVLAQQAVHGLSLSRVMGAFWIEYFPHLKGIPSWFPFAYFKRFGEQYRPIVMEMRDKPYNDVQAALERGEDIQCMAASLIQKVPTTGSTDYLHAEEELARNAAGIAYAAASDTTTSAAHGFFLAMAKYPEVQTKAQEELDRVVGPDRLPDFGDYEPLVYIRAVVLESMRWIPALPLALPHQVVEDDEYDGYYIPKGTTVVANVWAMLQDPQDYPNPETFTPERFIKDGDINPDVLDPMRLAFGFGRRVCPGRHLSNGSLFMTVACALHTFNISPAMDGKGKPVNLDGVSIKTGLVSGPETVPCVMTPRSEAAAELICATRAGSMA